MLYETKFLIALLLTLVVEVPIVFILAKYLFKSKIKTLEILFIGFIASTLTLPYLWFVLPPYINMSYYVLIVEILVFLFEALIYKILIKLSIFDSLAISLIANLLSFIIGLLIL